MTPKLPREVMIKQGPDPFSNDGTTGERQAIEREELLQAQMAAEDQTLN